MPRVLDDGGALTVGPPTEQLCKECYHAEQRTSAAKWREDRRDYLATLDADALAQLAQELAGAARDASRKEAIAVRPLDVQNQRRAGARLQETRLQVERGVMQYEPAV